MDVLTSRFGKVEVDDADVIQFPDGIIGFPTEKSFVLVPHGSSSLIGWLQSTMTPEFALPVVSAHALVSEYPDVALDEPAARSGVGGKDDELAVLAVLSAPASQPPTVNLLAPLLVNAATRRGAQVFLEGSRFTTQELFALPQATPGGETRAAASP